MQDIDPLLKIIRHMPERIDAIQRVLELLPQESQHRDRFLKLL
jgi:hypothetical protein